MLLRSFWLTCFFLLSSSLVFASSETYRIGFGSCIHQDRPQDIWDTIARFKPDRFLLIGDNIYGDSDDPQVLRKKYQELSSNPIFAAFRESTTLQATWDDHDYGRNDAGREYPSKRESQTAFLDFLGVAQDSPRREQEGIYTSELIEWRGFTIQLLLLDTRYFRSPLLKTSQGYRPNPDPQATLLGEAQWSWLGQELKKPAQLRILASSIQLLSQNHAYEKWDNFPLETQRLFDLIQETKAEGLVILSGDRHLGELSSIQDARISYPLYDFTSSGMTEGKLDQINKEFNARRVVGTKAHNISQFGLIELILDDSHPAPKLNLRLMSGGGMELEKLSFPLAQLQRATGPISKTARPVQQ